MWIHLFSFVPTFEIQWKLIPSRDSEYLNKEYNVKLIFCWMFKFWIWLQTQHPTVIMPIQRCWQNISLTLLLKNHAGQQKILQEIKENLCRSMTPQKFSSENSEIDNCHPHFINHLKFKLSLCHWILALLTKRTGSTIKNVRKTIMDDNMGIWTIIWCEWLSTYNKPLSLLFMLVHSHEASESSIRHSISIIESYKTRNHPVME